VFDVALWYEKADWYGIITTPNCQKIFEQSIKNRQIVKKMSKKFDEPVYLKGHFVKYPVPLKGGKTENLWVVSWPYQVIEEFEKKEKKGVTRDLVYNNFLPSENAKIERKRYNTNKFFNWYLDNIYDNVKQYEDKAREYLDSL